MNKEIDIDTMTVMPETLDLSTLEDTTLEVISLAHLSESLTNNTTIVPEEPKCVSIFGDEVCGEPMMSQQVVINFVPKDEDKEVSEKCCAFWKFVREHPELNHIMVKAEPKVFVTESSSSTPTTTTSTSSSGSFPTCEQPVVDEKSAVGMLGFVEDKGFIGDIFEAKLQSRYCESPETLGTYETEPLLSKPVRPKLNKEMAHEFPPGPSCPKAVALCDVLESWDQQHPKSMEPPGHPPRLSHSIMQRKIIRL